MNNEELRRNKYRRKKAMLRKVQNKMGVAFFVIILALFALAVIFEGDCFFVSIIRNAPLNF